MWYNRIEESRSRCSCYILVVTVMGWTQIQHKQCGRVGNGFIKSDNGLYGRWGEGAGTGGLEVQMSKGVESGARDNLGPAKARDQAGRDGAQKLKM